MKRIIFIVSLIFTTTLYGQKDKTYKCHLHEAGVDDFVSPTAEFEFSEKGKFTYLLSNDNSDLYIGLRIADKNVQRQIQRYGLTVWVNADGKKKKDIGIRYPVVSINAGYGGRPPQSGGQKPEQSKMTDSLHLIGFDGVKEKNIANNQAGNIRGSLKTGNNQVLFYELVVPMEILKGIAEKEKSKEFSIILGLSYPEAASGGMPPSGGGRPPSGGGGPPPGGGGSGPPQGGYPSGGGSSSSSGPQVLVWMDPLTLATGTN
jgi:hypothetical protein